MMLTSFVIAVALGQAAQTAPTQTYTDATLGLSLTHPATWILEQSNPPDTGKKKRRRKQKGDGTVKFRIPLPGAAEDGDLEIMRASFSGSPDTWQMVQVDANKNMHRQVERQWQQEILGVPMLLTRINYTDNGVNEATLTGLLYNDSPSKLLFRLTGPASDFDKAQYEFDQSLQTLRTTNNELPKPQDPNHPASKGAVDTRGQKHVLFADAQPPKSKLAAISVPLTVSTKKVDLRLPEGWEALHADGSSLELKSAALPYTIVVHLYSSLDSDPPATALLNASAASLADFKTVSRREDARPIMNVGGCVVTSIWRTGTGQSGPIMSMEAAGAKGDFYFIGSCRPIPGATYPAQRKAIDALLQAISIEPGA